MLRAIIFIFLLILQIANGQSNCQKKRDLIQHGRKDTDVLVLCPEDPCNDSSSLLDENEPCPTYCFVHNGICYLKTHKASSSTTLNAYYQSLQTKTKKQTKGTGIQGKNLFIGGNQGFPPITPYNPTNPTAPGSDICSNFCPAYGCQQQNFPFNCNLKINSIADTIKLLEPPVNVPYCVRIPCRPSNPTLETNHEACFSNPGCYFDLELSNLRRTIPGFLPGVPVCHLAIRNNNFQRLAFDYTRKSKQPWNPLFTNCLIDQNRAAISTPDPGCGSLDLFTYVGGYPKVAGWTGIKPIECQLINGCWLPTSRYQQYKCYYPGVINGFQVRAGKDPFVPKQRSLTDIYGRPLCQPFAIDTPQHYLNSYQQCKESGCVLDNSVNGESLYLQLYKLIGSYMSTANTNPQSNYLGTILLQQLLNGGITPNNYEQQISRLSQRCNTFPPLTPSTSVQPTPSLFFPYSYNLAQDQNGGQRSFNFGQPQTPTLNLQSLCAIYLQGNSINGQQQQPSLTPSSVQTFCRIILQSNYNNNGFGQPQPIFALNLIKQYCRLFFPGNNLMQLNIQRQIVPLCAGSGPQQPNFGCPFQSSFGGGYFSLKGSFAGCCEKHLCYIPRSQLVSQRSGSSAYIGEWINWSECNVKCGGGTRNRTRNCMHPKIDKDGKMKCIDDGSEIKEQTHKCNNYKCPEWSKWDNWSACSSLCGTGKSTRTRNCNRDSAINNLKCKGKSSEERPCTCTCTNCQSWATDNASCECSGRRKVRKRQRTCNSSCAVTQITDTKEETCPYNAPNYWIFCF